MGYTPALHPFFDDRRCLNTAAILAFLIEKPCFKGKEIMINRYVRLLWPNKVPHHQESNPLYQIHRLPLFPALVSSD